MGERPTKFRGTFQSYVLVKAWKGLACEEEEMGGGAERRPRKEEPRRGQSKMDEQSEDDVGDLLLGVDEVLENPAIPKREERERQRK